MINVDELRQYSVSDMMDALAFMRASPLFKEDWVRRGYDAVVWELKRRPQEDLVQYMLSLLDD